MLVFVLFASAYNLVFGYGGMLSLGHAALFGGGAYAAGILAVHAQWPWWAALASGALAGLVIGIVFAYLSLRVRGIYFAMITLALAQCVFFFAYRTSVWTGGDNGLRGVPPISLNIDRIQVSGSDPLTKYYLTFVIVAIALALLRAMLQTPFGRSLSMVRQNELRASACGVPVLRVRQLAFAVSGLLSGLAGALYAFHIGTVPLETLSVGLSGQVVMMVLLGGMGTFVGPVIGAILFLGAEHFLSDLTTHWQMVTGLLFMLLVLFFSKGIWGGVRELFYQLRDPAEDKP
ncbi:MAG: branched-chain amino acid ABC transporter permease [Proteobacteria bacterium]|nr:branched-chain amino acid ABC transporter permease [Pseudomonadota bacterium]